MTLTKPFQRLLRDAELAGYTVQIDERKVYVTNSERSIVYFPADRSAVLNTPSQLTTRALYIMRRHLGLDIREKRTWRRKTDEELAAMAKEAD